MWACDEELSDELGRRELEAFARKRGLQTHDDTRHATEILDELIATAHTVKERVGSACPVIGRFF